MAGRRTALAAVLGAAVTAGLTPATGHAADLPPAVVASSALQSAFVRIDAAPRFSFADSDLLANALRQGARGVDVFAGAGSAQCQALYRQRRTAKPVSFASTRLVVIVPRGNPGRVRSIAHLRRKDVSLLLSAASVSVGNQARAL
jgi:molybdate transport system substrate-binding protein